MIYLQIVLSHEGFKLRQPWEAVSLPRPSTSSTMQVSVTCVSLQFTCTSTSHEEIVSAGSHLLLLRSPEQEISTYSPHSFPQTHRQVENFANFQTHREVENLRSVVDTHVLTTLILSNVNILLCLLCTYLSISVRPPPFFSFLDVFLSQSHTSVYVTAKHFSTQVTSKLNT